MKTDGVNQLPDFHVRYGSNVYWQVKHVLVRHILRVIIVEGRSKPCCSSKADKLTQTMLIEHLTRKQTGVL